MHSTRLLRLLEIRASQNLEYLWWGGGGEEVGMARKSLGMGEREKYRKLSTSSGGKALILKNRNNQS